MAHAHATKRMAACVGVRSGGLGFIVGVSDNGWMDPSSDGWMDPSSDGWMGDTFPLCPAGSDPYRRFQRQPWKFTKDRRNKCSSQVQAEMGEGKNSRTGWLEHMRALNTSEGKATNVMLIARNWKWNSTRKSVAQQLSHQCTCIAKWIANRWLGSQQPMLEDGVWLRSTNKIKPGHSKISVSQSPNSAIVLMVVNQCHLGRERHFGRSCAKKISLCIGHVYLAHLVASNTLASLENVLFARTIPTSHGKVMRKDLARAETTWYLWFPRKPKQAMYNNDWRRA